VTRTRTLVAAVALAASAAACRDRADAEAERAVRDYDEALVQAFRASDARPLRAVALEEEANRVVVLVDLKRSNGIVLESTLERLEVTGTLRTGAGGRTVETVERWRYFDRPLAPGRPPGTVFVAEMRMRYELAREEGRWKVERVRTLSSKYLEPKGLAREAPHGTGAFGH
jgi:hypothetical protein